MKFALTASIALCHLSLASICLAQPPPAPAGSDYYGVIELGAKGIKPVVVQAGGRGPKGEVLLAHMVKSKYEIKNKNPYDGDATAAAVTTEVQNLRTQMINDFHMPPEHIYVVESSGLPKEAATRLAAKLQDDTPIYSITASKESELVFLGIVPPNRMKLNEVVVLDIGSGNSKGAYLTNNVLPYTFDTFNVPFGTGTFAKAIQTAQKPGGNFLAVAAPVAAEQLIPKVQEQIRSKPGMQNCSRLYLAGGLPFVMTTLLHPEKIGAKDLSDRSGKKESDWTELSIKDIDEFYNQATTNPELLQHPDISKLPPAVQAEITRAAGIFRSDELTAGAIVLRTFVDEMNVARKSKIFFSRAALFAWPQGFVMEKIRGGQ